MTTWHDLSDQLTDIQIAWIRDFENRYPADLDGGVARGEVLLDYARDHAAQNKIDRERFGHLPTPQDARRVGHWEDDGTGRWSRGFDGKDWLIRLPDEPQGANRVDLTVSGNQFDDGRVVWCLYVCAENVQVTSAQARELAAALIEAADELDKLADQ